MIELVRALAWLRWRMLVNSVRAGRRRDGFEVLSRIVDTSTRVLLAILLLPLALGLAFGALVGGALAVSSEEARFGIQVAARLVLGLITLINLIAPIVRSAQGLAPKLERMLLLPISRHALHAGDVLAQLSDPWTAIAIPAIVLLPVGLAVGGGWVAALCVALAGALALYTLAALSAAIGWGMVLLFRDRRRGEAISLVVFVVLMLFGLLPMWFGQAFEQAARDRTLEARFDAVSAWIAPLPSELYGRIVLDSLEGRPAEASARLGALAVIGTVFFAASSILHRRAVTGVASGSSRRRVRGHDWLADGLPWIGREVSAVAQAFVRQCLRTVRGRMSVYFPFIPLVILRLVFGDRFTAELSPMWARAIGPLTLLFAALIVFLSLQPIVLNQFAVCGAGLTLESLTPLSARQIVAGRIVGSAWLAAIAYGLAAVSLIVLSPSAPPLLSVAASLAAVSCFVLVAPLSSVLSALLPKTSDLGRMGRSGNPHALANFLGVFVTPMALAPGALVLAFVGIVANRPGLAVALELAWLAVACAIAYPLAVIAASVFERRRENLLLVAAGR